MQNFVVAQLLYGEKGLENYEKSYQSLELALNLIPEEDKDSLPHYYDKMIELKNKLINKLDNPEVHKEHDE